MGFIKDIKLIIEKLEDLDRSTKQKAKKLDEIESYLSKVNLKIKRVVEIPSVDGEVNLRIDYEVPSQFLVFDTEGNVIENPTFKAINMLNLVSFEDMAKVSNAIKNKKR